MNVQKKIGGQSIKGGYGNAPILILLLVALVTTSCSVRRMAMNMVANSLTGQGSGNVFTGDNDPELVGDALPFAIKMYESLMASVPQHTGLRLQTGSMYIMYANAYLQTPAGMMEDNKFSQREKLLQRARNLYLRGRDIILQALENRHPGFRESLGRKPYDQAVSLCTIEDVPLLYWAAAGWVAAYAIDPFDMEIGLTIPQAEALMRKVLKLDHRFGNGSIHDFFILYYGSMPEYMGGDPEKARKHFRESVELSQGHSTTPYLSLATTVCIKQQKAEEFRNLLRKALEISPDHNPDNRLVTVINQRKARWLLDHLDNFFLESEKDFRNPDPSVEKTTEEETQ